MKVYVVRHGQSEANLGKFLAGWAEVSLTSKGIADAERAGKALAALDIDKVYTSDTLRAVQTCQAALPHAEYEKSSLIREYDVGSLTYRTFAECAEEEGDRFWQNVYALDFSSYGGEDTPAVDRRVGEFMRQLEQCGHERVAVFAHEGTMRRMMSYAMGVSVTRQAVGIANGTILTLEYLDGNWRVILQNI